MQYIKTLSAILSAIFLLAFSGVTAADWFLSSETKALIAKADAGDVDAQFRVGSAYDTGNGAPRSSENAMKYYLMAAEKGHADAQNSVGSALQAEEKYSEALVWFERAAAQGHALATNNLAFLYDLGRGVKQDRRKGFELYFTVTIDLIWSKRRIMEVYLNVIETGDGIYGTEAAARDYFHKSAKNLSRSEAALIAACLPNPRKRNPAAPTPYLLRRQARILNLMNKIGDVKF